MNLFFYWTVFVGAVFTPCSRGQGLVKETTNGSTALQPWLVGLTAVTVFLFVMFVANLIHRIFFSQKKDDKDEMENIETKHSTEQNVYENKAMDPEEGDLETNM
ncbi:small integral membrane protein 24 isoform X1 [Notechis scutatus]|uniref:Small integral membrane protein 24 isoform X1 n=1 Tax=Notechis scutatus TaxID=8663 RepID=A0A6J1V867_9SAUR|nr:small integral membrane protein 24 isoform X1 [Notechis scutatus]